MRVQVPPSAPEFVILILAWNNFGPPNPDACCSKPVRSASCSFGFNRLQWCSCQQVVRPGHHFKAETLNRRRFRLFAKHEWSIIWMASDELSEPAKVG